MTVDEGFQLTLDESVRQVEYPLYDDLRQIGADAHIDHYAFCHDRFPANTTENDAISLCMRGE